MSGVYDETILRILQEAAREAVEASTLPTLPIKYVMRTFNVPDNQKYLECVFLPNNIVSGYWGDERDYRGTFRLILHWPNDDQGAYSPMALLSSISAYFSTSTPLQNVQICDMPNLTGVLEMGSENLLPCSMRYQCFRP